MTQTQFGLIAYGSCLVIVPGKTPTEPINGVNGESLKIDTVAICVIIALSCKRERQSEREREEHEDEAED